MCNIAIYIKGATVRFIYLFIKYVFSTYSGSGIILALEIYQWTQQILAVLNLILLFGKITVNRKKKITCPMMLNAKKKNKSR